ncbi:MAG: M1 family aminopeptidase, partial [Bryobacteraceae bacterium]
VTSAAYQDDWLMEALANYSALLMLERRKGARALESVLSSYREHLLSKNEEGETRESAGPVRLGLRLRSSLSPDAWRVVLYEKGSWIIHMLRRRMGDERFLKMLGEVVRRYRLRPIGTDDFRVLAAEFLAPGSPDPKLQSFFDSWVYGTGVPTVKMTHAVKGKAPALRLTVTLSQSGVAGDFEAHVPVRVEAPGMKPVVRWVRTGSEPETITLNLRRGPARVAIDPDDSVLMAK